MIEFGCGSCGKRFRVPDEYAGRPAKCKACGAAVTVPAAAALPGAPALMGLVGAPVATAPARVETPSAEASRSNADAHARLPMRTRRLMADARSMADAFGHSGIIKILDTEGDPPDVYRVEYLIRSLAPGDDPEEPTPRDVHQVEIRLTADYPRVSPQCRMLTPVYHPNIDPSHVCVGDHWTAGERLVDLVVRIGEMLAYQAYNIRSPLDAHAAMWADLNSDKLPTDPRTIRPADME
jgi:ubiquitin-protein ligase